MRKLAIILRLKSKLSGKFQCFSAVDKSENRNAEKMLNFQKFQLK